MKKALLVTTVSGFVPQFELNNVRILQSMGYEVHYAPTITLHPMAMTITGSMESGLSAIKLILCAAVQNTKSDSIPAALPAHAAGTL